MENYNQLIFCSFAYFDILSIIKLSKNVYWFLIFFLSSDTPLTSRWFVDHIRIIDGILFYSLVIIFMVEDKNILNIYFTSQQFIMCNKSHKTEGSTPPFLDNFEIYWEIEIQTGPWPYKIEIFFITQYVIFQNMWDSCDLLHYKCCKFEVRLYGQYSASLNMTVFHKLTIKQLILYPCIFSLNHVNP